MLIIAIFAILYDCIFVLIINDGNCPSNRRQTYCSSFKKVAYESSGSYGLKCSLYNVLMHINNIHLVDTS